MTISTSHYQQLRQAFSAWGRLTDAQWEPLAEIFRGRTAVPKQFVTLPGSEKHELIFVCDGLLRFYYVGEDGKETNKAFLAEGEFGGPLASAMMGLPLYFGIQALEPTSMLVASFEAFTALFPRHQVYERLGRKLAESLLMRKELRMRSLLENNAKERYLRFCQKNPHLVERVPQYHLASYLGIAEVSLSRLKNSLSNSAS